MKPLIVLINAFVISIILTYFIGGHPDFEFSGILSFSIMLLFTAIAHFTFTKGMSMMLPHFVPYKSEIVYLTGIIEIGFALTLLIPNLRIMTAWLLMVFLILILPANIYAAQKHINYQKGTFEGKGISYLWFRIPLQLFYIAWIFYFCLS